MNIENVLDKLLSMSEENEVVEFKKAETQFEKDKLGQYFSALSNEANLKGLKNAWMVLELQITKRWLEQKFRKNRLMNTNLR